MKSLSKKQKDDLKSAVTHLDLAWSCIRDALGDGMQGDLIEAKHVVSDVIDSLKVLYHNPGKE